MEHLNPDGGIPATKVEDESGLWTTAEALEIFLITSYFPKEKLPEAKRMIEFLLNRQLHPSGGWPLVAGSLKESTMTTGHAVAALSISYKVFSHDSQLTDKIKKSIDEALNWLREHQNIDGGWGVEPVPISGEEGKESRMISTVYALHGFFANELLLDSRNVRDAIDYIIKAVNNDGGWGLKKGVESDSSNTARALIALIQSGKYNKESPVIKKGLKFLLSQKDSLRAFTETYVASAAAGETVFNSNTPFDALDALLRLDYLGDEVKNLIGFFTSTQEDNGSWYISPSLKKVKPINTWPTSEAIFVLDLAQKRYVCNFFKNPSKGLSLKWKIAIYLLALANIFQFIYIISLESAKQFIVQYLIFGVIATTFITILLGVIANAVTPEISKIFHNIKDNILKK